ncbi:hypothetical protein AADG42_11510 [Ammonicoccus fulvus]|uniref:Knr4/Smi1-like domain-containing protein n=1 Tax=Ammonicoccus fulvus TaxID=3138240 RepID=A0ABZ3FPA7_9ACTN
MIAGEDWQESDTWRPALDPDLLDSFTAIAARMGTRTGDWEVNLAPHPDDRWDPRAERILIAPGLVMALNPGDRSLWLCCRFAWAAGWRVADRHAFWPADPEPPNDPGLVVRELGYAVGLPPYRRIGEPGWAEEARRYYDLHLEDDELRPCSEAEIVAAEARCGRRLPETLRTWFAELGQHNGELKADRLRPLDPAELPPDIPEPERTRLAGALSFGNGDWLDPDPPHAYHRWVEKTYGGGEHHVESLEDFLSVYLNNYRWIPTRDRDWLTPEERGY